MEKKKREYLAPSVEVKQVEIESSICGGSVDITAESPNGVSTTAQEVNTDFGNDNDFSSGSNWDQ